jgi:hypothetical protein
MSDIVKVLRGKHALDYDEKTLDQFCNEAADEIEKLRAALRDLLTPQTADARIAKARRDALEEAAQWHDEQRESSESGLEYSSLVGIPIANATDLRSSAKTHEWCAAVIRALGEKE